MTQWFVGDHGNSLPTMVDRGEFHQRGSRRHARVPGWDGQHTDVGFLEIAKTFAVRLNIVVEIDAYMTEFTLCKWILEDGVMTLGLSPYMHCAPHTYTH